MNGESRILSIFIKGLMGVLCGCIFTGIGTTTLRAESGSAWSSLGSGMDEEVNALAVAPDGTLYAGGKFTVAGGKRVNHVARWDGHAWYPLGTGTDSDVYTLAIAPDGTLYAGGDFGKAGGRTAKNVAQWDGRRWSALGSGPANKEESRSLVFSLAVAPDGTLYAGGMFDSAGGEPSLNIAKWNGTSWSAMGEGIEDAVSCVTVAPDGTVYAGGDFRWHGGSNIARWNGTDWVALGQGLTNRDQRHTFVNSLAVAPNGALYAGGDFSESGKKKMSGVAKWNASKWSALGKGTDGNAGVQSLALSPDGTLYAGGFFEIAGGKSAKHIAKWNGSAWSPLGAGVAFSDKHNAIVHAIAIAPDGTVYVGGQFVMAGGKRANAVAAWK
jgi:ubiquitin-protein ligase